MGISQLVERRTRDWKDASSVPGRSGGWIFFAGVSFLFWLLFGVRSIPVLPQWHVQDPGHFFFQKRRWQVTSEHAYTLDPTKSEWTDYAVQAKCWNLLEQRTHKQLAREHSAIVISARWATVDWSLAEREELVRASWPQLKRKSQAGNDSSNLPQHPRMRGKIHGHEKAISTQKQAKA